MKMRVWWIPQVPMKPFIVQVSSLGEGIQIMDILADYDKFQLDNNIKPDYCNAGGIEVFDTNDSTSGPDGSWVDWWDEDTGEDDPYAFVTAMK